MLKLNENLFKNLTSALRMTYKEISSQSNISMTTLYRIIETPSKISVQQLIDLANGLRVPVSRFFTKDNKEPIGQREDYIKFNDYKLCYFDKGAIQRVIDSGSVSSYREIASVLGLHPNRVKESLFAEHRLPVTRLITFCTTFNLYFYDFVIDPNTPIVSSERDKTIALHYLNSKANNISPEDFFAMRLEMVKLRQELFDTKQELDTLRQNQNSTNMIRNEIKAPVTFFSGIRILYDTKDLEEPLHSWFQKLITKSPYDTFFFAKTGDENNSVRFYTEDGVMFYEAKCDSDLSNLLFREGIMPGKICANCVKDNSSIIELRANLVANAREDRKDTADFAMFRKEIIQKFG